MKKSKEYGKSVMHEIATAKTKEEVETLLVKCTTIKNASPDTVRKWDRTARRRLAAIASCDGPACTAKEQKDA